MISYEKYTLKQILDKNRNGELLLPNFQRDYVWKRAEQVKLAISCLLSLPIGGLLMLKGNKDVFSHKEIAGIKKVETEKDTEVQFLLDGQQRITTLNFLFDDPFSMKDKNWEDLCRELPQQLKAKFSLDISYHEFGSDPFGYKTLSTNSLTHLEPSDLANRVKSQPVNITGVTTTQFHHPKKFTAILEKSRERNNPDYIATLEICKEYADKNIIPLSSILWDENYSVFPYALHKKVIELLAYNRMYELKEEYARSSEEETLEFFNIQHKGITEDIYDYEEDSYNLDKGWEQLRLKWIEYMQGIFDKIQDMVIPSIDLPKEEVSRAAAIFEELNNSGTKLTVFDLLVARAARSDFLGNETLSDFIIRNIKSKYDVSVIDEDINNWSPSELNVMDGKVLDRKFQELYLNLLSLISNAKLTGSSPDDVKYIGKELTLRISPYDINFNTKRTILGIARALAILQLKCGVHKLSEVGYQLMILPIAYCLEEDRIWKSRKYRNRILYWYWLSIFEGRYRERPNERCVQDVSRLYKWVTDDINPYDGNQETLILNNIGYNDENTLLHENKDNLPNKNVLRSIIQFVLSRNPEDLYINRQSLRARDWSKNNVVLQKHHIIPLATATTIQQSSAEIREDKSHILNSPLNMVLISDIANKAIGSLEIETYANKLNEEALMDNLIPTRLNKNPEEDDNAYYSRLISERYVKLKQSIRENLKSLLEA
ncbi:DUF262 domain-containing protein [Vibrio breoganii]|uniref:DUF262 domain-containing protein n=1 Tax=Vibrio breoganii TaxID=553239 RepID=UPI000C86223B|nr:DUF262 domain-containing protein [Vibrio breoganii]PMK41599.1 hypothetical protein BCU00_13990 [Vibrio breoganii]